MRLGPHYTAIVDLRIDMPIELPTDTSAAIHTDGLFGQKHVVLVPGADDKVLKAGSSITLTQDSVLVGDLLELIIGEGKAKLGKKEPAKSTEAPKTSPGSPGSLMAPLLSDPADPK
jgi:phospholipid/cholesterol/gamma-HCH transport system substrate-binding protein